MLFRAKAIANTIANTLRFTGLAATFMLAFSMLTGCDQASVERRYYPNGSIAEEAAYLTDEGGHRVRHGLRMHWHVNGERSRLEVYNRGKQTGYIIRWDDQGRLLERHHASVAEHFDSALPSKISVSSATTLNLP